MKKHSDKILNIRSEEVVLLITGCINPYPNQKWLVLKDSGERLKQYIDSIKFYIEKTNFANIVFCDNSCYKYENIEILEQYAKENSKRFEWISFRGDTDKVIVCGKGYGEGEIIKYALAQSELLSGAQYFAKVTGRLKILNLENVLCGLEKGNNYFNRDIYRGHGIDTRFYVCNIEYYKKYLLNIYLKTDVTNKIIALEDLFYIELNKVKNYRSLMAYPSFLGVSGGNGRDYAKMSQKWIKIYSFFCKHNWFNQCFTLVLVFQKGKIMLHERFAKNGKY